ncbi:Kinesin motor domain [Carpediemonas membranifera]|uniref:Kinesin motor domain n=1 Tax=Carpediemonas membranifera TaxID=201153 RepID=A0A8J6APV0_9EUKA|nr:Kinesin motor domain [Carpediemonas membranifera]|eukprot:KAG9390526.1 Kinesin motor domain [Carpediemonas membranifera]
MAIKPTIQQLKANRAAFERLIAHAESSVNEEPEPASVGKDFTVVSRTRPIFEHEDSFRIIYPHGRTVTVHEPTLHFRADKAKLDDKSFTLNHNFGPSSSNEEVYEMIGTDFINLPAGGGTAVLFAYGQTGTGKTYTVNAITKLMAQDLFNALSPTQKVVVSFVEILGDAAYDLPSHRPVRIMEDKFSSVVLDGCDTRDCPSPEAFLEMSETALAHRRTVATLKNDTSSRSHALTKISVLETDPVKSAGGASEGILFLVDLAGSERAADRAAHDAARLEEAKQINTSLMTLKDCIKGRARQGTGAHLHIPYRSSKLTLVLKDIFELATVRPTRCVVVACTSPHAADASHSINTLRYAQTLMSAPKTKLLAPNKHDPKTWSKERACSWLTAVSKGALNVADMLPNEGDNGLVLSQLTEQEFIERATRSGKVDFKRAKAYYVKLWEFVADARTKQRKAVLKARDKTAAQKEEDQFHKELIARSAREAAGWTGRDKW